MRIKINFKEEFFGYIAADGSIQNGIESAYLFPSQELAEYAAAGWIARAMLKLPWPNVFGYSFELV